MIRLKLSEELRFFIMNMKMNYSTFSILFQCIPHFSRDRDYRSSFVMVKINLNQFMKISCSYILHLYLIKYCIQYINVFYQDVLKNVLLILK